MKYCKNCLEFSCGRQGSEFYSEICGDAALHNIKLNIEFCDDVYKHKKNFEIRKNDRNYKQGDFIKFIPVNSEGETIHEVMEQLYVITYVLSGWGIKEGFVGLGIKEITARADY